jgi:glycosyltransferase involved in cell wall biosynthesis
MRLSVVIPVYNEAATLAAVVSRVAGSLKHVSKEIIVVDDGSTDGTGEWLKANFPSGAKTGGGIAVDEAGELVVFEASETGPITVIPVFHSANLGKGHAVRTGFALATGDVVVIQDADLEYDPADWDAMFDLVATRGVADVVYGSRFYGRPHRSLAFHHYLGNRLISILFSMLYNQTLTDIETCYKMMTDKVLRSLQLSCDDFGIEIEISAQIARQRHWRIYELGISYFGRTHSEGKKIDWKDGVKALWYLLKFRLA